ncbi:MAG TPA: TlpA disulfide reductase family protein [Candidatus Kapabacteria bacterium]|nr:TlpA disulfide reductase family protein [Candidatus Kapabacteria bacterium]
MNKIIKVSIFFGILLSISLYAQESTLPKVQIKDIYGKSIDASTLTNNGKPFVIDFWATWCNPCIRELTNINKVYEKWQTETGVKVFAISIDDSRTSKKVPQFVKGRGWKFDIYLDENSDLKRAMNAGYPPQTFLFDGSGKLVWQHSGYAEGNEEELYNKIKELGTEPNQENKKN